MDCNPPGSSIHEIFQARTLEWVTFLAPICMHICIYVHTLYTITLRLPFCYSSLSPLGSLLLSSFSIMTFFLFIVLRIDFQQHPGSQQHQHIYLLLNLTITLIPCQNHFAYTVDKRTTKSLGFVCNFFLTTSSCPELRVVRYCKWFGLVLFFSLFSVYSRPLKYNLSRLFASVLVFFCLSHPYCFVLGFLLLLFLPGESQGSGSLEGCRLWCRTESDTTKAT